MHNFQKRLLIACNDLNLEIYLDHTIRLSSNQELVVPVLIPNLGAENGIIVVTSFDDIRDFEKKINMSLAGAGYGYSCLSDFSGEYDRDSTIEMFSDWGWNGPEKDKPSWMIDIPDDDA